MHWILAGTAAAQIDMKAFYDLHIHSVLSPCAEQDMTPNNIVNMAMLIGLDVIAVTDHNSADNTPAVAKLAKDAGLCFIPGIEVTTAEEVHMIGLFAEVDSALRFGELVYAALPNIKNKPEFFGAQQIMDEHDAVIGEKEKLLISATHYGIEECCTLIQEHGGIYIPAHVNKEANSILANLGFFPPQIHFPTIEVWRGGMPVETELYRVLHNSDAHMLEQISEKENFLEVEKLQCKAIWEELSR